jgi:adenylate kinase
MKNIIFIAPPAAGKGTMSEMLGENYVYEHISTVDLIRAEVKDGNKEL